MAASTRLGPILFFVILYLATSVQGIQSVCQANGTHYVKDADVRFGLLISLREDSSDASNSGTRSSCQISSSGLQHYLAVEWLVDKFNGYNNSNGYISGVKIGFTAFDDCNDAAYATRNTVTFFEDQHRYIDDSCTEKTANVPYVGIIGPTSSPLADDMAAILNHQDVPVISPTAAPARPRDSDTVVQGNLFRTVPSGDSQMSVIADILYDLQWTYVIVAYDNHPAGLAALEVLTQKVMAKRICISDTVPLSLDATKLKDTFENIVAEKAKDNSIAVVVLADTANANQLFDNLKRLNIHFIFAQGIKTKEMDKVGSLAFAPPSVLPLDELKEYMKSQTNHPLVKEYLSQHPGQTMTVTSSNLDPYLQATIDALLTLVNAIQSLHTTACGLTDGVCSDMKSEIEQGKLITLVKENTVNYNEMALGVLPISPESQDYTFTFDPNGDIRVGNSFPTYDVYQCNTSKSYNKIGSYIDNNLKIEWMKTRWLTSSGTFTTTKPTSVCAGNCQNCLNPGQIPVAFEEGDVYIVGIFSLNQASSQNPFKCGESRYMFYDPILTEAFLFSVREVRKNTGVKFGAIVFNDCYSPLRIQSILSDYFSGLVPSDSPVFSRNVPLEKIVGVVGCLSSGCTIPVASFFMRLNVPVVSFAASSPDLDDRINYPYLVRTVPSDLYQAKVMVNIIHQMEWEYVGVMYVRNNYGMKGIQAFKKLAAESSKKICILQEFGIGEKKSSSDAAEFLEATLQFVGNKVKVVVFFGIDSRFEDFLQYLEMSKINGQFIFLASEDWGNNDNIRKAGVKASNGTLTLAIQTISVEKKPNFDQHLLQKKPSNNDPNVWFREFWQNTFQCSFPGGFNNKFDRYCDPSQSLTPQMVKTFSERQRLEHVMSAVFALGNALKVAKETLCDHHLPCADGVSTQKIIDLVKEQTRLVGSVPVPIFDSNGNGAIGFDVYNIRKKGDDTEYVKVGSANGDHLSLDVDLIKANPATNVKTTCSGTICSICKRDDGTLSLGGDDSDSFRVPDIVIVSLVILLILAIILAVVAVIFCIKRRTRVLEKKLDNKQETTERVYETVRRVVPGDYIPQGLVKVSNFASPYGTSIQGAVNPTFEGDYVDSSSNGSRKPPTESDTSIATTPMTNTTNVTSRNSHIARPQLPLPQEDYVSVISDRSRRNRQDDSPLTPYLPIVLDPRSLPQGGIPVLANPQERPGSPLSDGVIYYVQDSNGQLYSRHTMSPTLNTQPRQHNSSVRSKASLHPEYGPYSSALAQQQQLRRFDPSPQPSERHMPKGYASSDDELNAQENDPSTGAPWEEGVIDPRHIHPGAIIVPSDYTRHINNIQVHHQTPPPMSPEMTTKRNPAPNRTFSDSGNLSDDEVIRSSKSSTSVEHSPQHNPPIHQHSKYQNVIKNPTFSASLPSIPDVIGELTLSDGHQGYLNNQVSLDSMRYSSREGSPTPDILVHSEISLSRWKSADCLPYISGFSTVEADI